MVAGSDQVILESILNITEGDLRSIWEFNHFMSTDFEINVVPACFYSEVRVTVESEHVVRAFKSNIRNRRMVANLLQIHKSAIAQVCLISFTEHRVQRLQPVVSWINVCKGGHHGLFHPHKRIIRHSSYTQVNRDVFGNL